MNTDTSPLSRPPLNILVNPDTIRRKKPWEIDLNELLDTFIRILVESRSPDLRLCGSVALSSALIYRLKVETLFLFEKIRIERQSSNVMEPPQLLFMPFRHETYTTSVQDLLYALDRTLQEILSESRRKKIKPQIMEPATSIEIDPHPANIMEALLVFKERLLTTLKAENEVIFGDYVQGLLLVEKVRAFILLLIVAMDGLIHIEQFGEDIKVTSGVSGGNWG